MRLRAKRVRKRLRAKGLRQWRAAVGPRLRAAGGSRIRGKGGVRRLTGHRLGPQAHPRRPASGGIGSGTRGARSGVGIGLSESAVSRPASRAPTARGRSARHTYSFRYYTRLITLSMESTARRQGCEPRTEGPHRPQRALFARRQGCGPHRAARIARPASRGPHCARPQHAPAARGPDRARPQQAPATKQKIQYIVCIYRIIQMESTKDMHLYF